MADLNQDERLLRIETALGPNAFVATDMQGQELISGLFEFQVNLLSTELSVEAKSLVGQGATVGIHFLKGNTRYVNGIVSEFQAYGIVDGVRNYRIKIVPTLYLLTLNHGSVMYSAKTTKDIISEVLKKAAVQFKYTASVQDKREYCIQYQESDFDFISRLMAEEGLSYYFDHKQGSHEMVIVDNNNQYIDCAESKVECEEDNAGRGATTSRILSWSKNYQMHTGNVALTGYLESSAGKGKSISVATKNKDISSLKKFTQEFHESTVPYALKDEMPDYGAKLTQKRTAAIILEHEEAKYETAEASSNCCTFTAGGRFELVHPKIKSENGKYLITRVDHSVQSRDGAYNYTNHISAVPSTVVFHPAPPTERLRIHGPHLATVLEVKAGENPSASDPQLMVKLCFYWDEKKTSCWVRVMQNYAGASQGAIFVPRVNSEVVVEFVGGDPDRPLVTGAVYNSENKAPQYSKTQSGFKTGSKNFNEFRFDDKKDSEEIYMHAGKDYNYLVVNDETGEVQNNQTLKVVKDRSITVEGNETKKITGKQELSVDGDQSTAIKGNQDLSVDGNQTEKIKGNQEFTVDGNQKFTVKGSHDLKVTGASNYKSSQAITMEASTGITLKVGSNSIKIDNSGITIKGMMVKINGDTTLEAKGGASAEVSSGGILTLKGSLTKIN